jgi:glycosyltransferase involved in cell wall biosynthesis
VSRPLVSIVLATFERGHLLARSLQTFAASKGIHPPEDLEVVVVDDHSTDVTAELVNEWSRQTHIRSVLVKPCPKFESWRDCGAVLNHGIRASTGRHVLLTHPEVMVGKRSIARCVDKLEGFEEYRGRFTGSPDWSDRIGLYACCRVYYLSPREQVLLDTVDWSGKGTLAVRDIPEFYELDTNGNPDYSHRATDIVAQPGSRMPVWESWVFGGCSRETWKRLGGMLETSHWGSVDIAFAARRKTLGIPNFTCPEEDTIVIHQNHDLPGNVPTPQVMEDWVAELKTVDLTNPTKLVYPAVDFL